MRYVVAIPLSIGLSTLLLVAGLPWWASGTVGGLLAAVIAICAVPGQ